MKLMTTREAIAGIIMNMVSRDVRYEPLREPDFQQRLDNIVSECEEVADEIERGDYWLTDSEKKDISDSNDSRV